MPIVPEGSTSITWLVALLLKIKSPGREKNWVWEKPGFNPARKKKFGVSSSYRPWAWVFMRRPAMKDKYAVARRQFPGPQLARNPEGVPGILRLRSNDF